MRLTAEERKKIRQQVSHVFNEFEQKITLITQLQQVLGDQKIDIVIAKDANRLIEQDARKKVCCCE